MTLHTVQLSHVDSVVSVGDGINYDVKTGNNLFILSGTSNDSWTGGSIVSQLNPDILEKIKNCFQVGTRLVSASLAGV